MPTRCRPNEKFLAPGVSFENFACRKCAECSIRFPAGILHALLRRLTSRSNRRANMDQTVAQLKGLLMDCPFRAPVELPPSRAGAGTVAVAAGICADAAAWAHRRPICGSPKGKEMLWRTRCARRIDRGAQLNHGLSIAGVVEIIWIRRTPMIRLFRNLPEALGAKTSPPAGANWQARTRRGQSGADPRALQSLDGRGRWLRCNSKTFARASKAFLISEATAFASGATDG